MTNGSTPGLSNGRLLTSERRLNGKSCMNARRKKGAKSVRIVERKLGRERALGQARFDKNLIEIDPRQPSREYLDTVLHEGLHLIFPELAERRVASVSRKLTRLVWKQGFRRIRR